MTFRVSRVTARTDSGVPRMSVSTESMQPLKHSASPKRRLRLAGCMSFVTGWRACTASMPQSIRAGISCAYAPQMCIITFRPKACPRSAKRLNTGEKNSRNRASPISGPVWLPMSLPMKNTSMASPAASNCCLLEAQ